MVWDYRKSESTICPELIDTTSSKTTAYIRKDVVEKQRTDEITGETYTYYEYLEAKIPKAEYSEYRQERQQADIDYIALMTGIDLEV